MEKVVAVPSKSSKPPKKPSSGEKHPKTSALVLEAITADGDKRGLSLILIKKYIKNKYPEIDIDKVQVYIKKFIRQALKDGILTSKTNSTISRLKIVKQKVNEKPAKKPSAKKPSAEKPAAKKTKTKEEPTGKGKSLKITKAVNGERKERQPKLKKAATKKIRMSMTALQPPKGKKAAPKIKPEQEPLDEAPEDAREEAPEGAPKESVAKPKKTAKKETGMSDKKDEKPVDKKESKAKLSKEAAKKPKKNMEKKKNLSPS